MAERDFEVNFKKATQDMIATNDKAYSMGKWDKYLFRDRLKDYSLQEVDDIINRGSLLQQQQLSSNYFYKDGFYKRVIIYYSTLLKYAGLLIPSPSSGKSLSTSHIQKRYFSAMDFIDRIPIESLCINFAQKILVNGCYFGVIQTLNKTTFSVLDLPHEWCRTRFKDAQNNDIIEFDVSYFNTIFDPEDRESALSVYPKCVSRAYHKLSSGGGKWVFIPSEIGICFPLFDTRPIFLPSIPSTIQYDATVETELEKGLEDIRKIIVQKIPHLNDGALLFEPTEAESIHKGSVGMMKNNKNTSILTTYADVTAIDSRTTSNTVSNEIEKMASNVYNNFGVSGQLFASTGSATLDYSIKNDKAFMMVLALKFSTFFTNLVNRVYANSNITFKYSILPITYYDDIQFADTAFKYASSGYSYLYPAIALGLSQKDILGLKDLENDVLKLNERLIPLQSGFNTANAGEESDGGRPQKEDGEKAEQTVKNEESNDNTAGGSN